MLSDIKLTRTGWPD